jgi:hypothetical protein
MESSRSRSQIPVIDPAEASDSQRATAPWPYALLCLAWRLGWGGRRLVTRDQPPPSVSMLHSLAVGGDRFLETTGTTASSVEPGGASWSELDGEHEARADEHEIPLMTVERMYRLLARSRLAEAIADAVHVIEAARRTAVLVGAASSPGRDLTVPGFWVPAFRTWTGFQSPCLIPSPRTRWDPATWTLLGVLEAAWETTGTTFIGRERQALFRIAGTRRMATRYGWSDRRALACGRTAHRIWRHWFETTERRRLARLRDWPMPPRLRAELGDPALMYRSLRAAVRTGQRTPDLDALPAAYDALLRPLARASVDELRRPVVPERPAGLRPAVAKALLLTPLGLAAEQSAPDPRALWARANQTAARLLWVLTAPWPWAPRPVVRGPRRARQEARARARRIR